MLWLRGWMIYSGTCRTSSYSFSSMWIDRRRGHLIASSVVKEYAVGQHLPDRKRVGAAKLEQDEQSQDDGLESGCFC